MNALSTRSTFWRDLRARWFGPAQRHPACGLGIDALPDGVGRLPIGSPVALAWQDRAPDLQWVHALLLDLLAQGPLFVLSETKLAADPLLQHPQLAKAFAQGRLIVWLMAANPVAASRPYGMQPLFREMQRAGLSDHHALLVLASPRAQMGKSVAEVQRWGQQLGRWCRGRQRPVVFAFNQWDNAQQVLGPLHSLAEVFQHVAVLGSEAQHPMLFVERWNASSGPLFEARFGLKPDSDSQRLAYDGSQRSGQLQRLVEAPDQYQVIATQAVLAGQRGVPAAWQVVAQLDAVLDATQDAMAATVLLHSGATAQVEDLLQLVFQLRSRHGRALKIVVRETQDKLRSNVEQALLCLGANVVVYREVGFARMLRLLDDLSDTTFARDIQPDFAAARLGFMPDPVRGYLAASAFCNTVESMLARTAHMGLRHSFLRLTMQSHVAHLDAVRACMPLRDGDVVTADHDALYVFMFACSEADIDPALARLFSIPATELFAAQTIYGSMDGMRSALRDLREEARRGAPDYSVYRRERPTAETPARPAPELPAPVAHLQDQEAPGPATPVATPTVRNQPLARRQPETRGVPHAD